MIIQTNRIHLAMKKIFMFAIALSIALSSCRHDENEEPIGKTFTAGIRLNMNGIVDQGQMSTKSLKIGAEFGKAKNDLYAIQIKDNADKVIAGGLFTGSFLFTEGNNLEVTLEHGQNYSIESTLVIAAENVLFEPIQGDGPKTYGAPFSLTGTKKGGKDQSKANCPILTNLEDWNTEGQIEQFEDLTAQTDKDDRYVASQGKAEDNLRPGDRWYFKKDITADYNQPGIDINLRRVSVKFTYTITNKNQAYTLNSAVGTATKSGRILWDIKNGDNKVFTLPNIATVYNQIIKEENENSPVSLYMGIYDGNKEIKGEIFEANLEANHYYEVSFDANLKKRNGLSITTSDVWPIDPTPLNQDN